MKQYITSLAISTGARTLQGTAMVLGGCVVTVKAATGLLDGAVQMTTAAVENGCAKLSQSASFAEAHISMQNAAWKERRESRKHLKMMAANAHNQSKKEESPAIQAEVVVA